MSVPLSSLALRPSRPSLDPYRHGSSAAASSRSHCKNTSIVVAIIPYATVPSISHFGSVFVVSCCRDSFTSFANAVNRRRLSL